MNEIVVFVKRSNLNLPLSHPSPPCWVSLYLQNSLEFFVPKIWSIYSLKFVGQGDVESFFLTEHCFYNKRYLQWATRGDPKVNRKKILLTFYDNDLRKFTKIWLVTSLTSKSNSNNNKLVLKCFYSFYFSVKNGGWDTITVSNGGSTKKI